MEGGGSMKLDFPTLEPLEIERRRKKSLEEEQITRERELLNIVPQAFQKTDQGKLNASHLATALTWANNPGKSLNLLISGKTGVGKTRIAWEAIKERYTKHGGRPKAIGAESFTRRMAKEGELMEKLTWARLLLLDDLGKERSTSTSESLIFELIRERIDNEKPTIFTTNYDPTGLQKKFSESETGAAILRRLTENIEIIDFNEPQ